MSLRLEILEGCLWLSRPATRAIPITHGVQNFNHDIYPIPTGFRTSIPIHNTHRLGPRPCLTASTLSLGQAVDRDEENQTLRCQAPWSSERTIYCIGGAKLASSKSPTASRTDWRSKPYYTVVCHCTSFQICKAG